MSASAVIYLDIGTIHNEILRCHPEITQSSGYLNLHTTERTWAIICDTSACADGQEIEVYEREQEDYYGFVVEIARWRPVN